MKKFILFPLFLLPLFSIAAPDPAKIESVSESVRRALIERGCRSIDDRVLTCENGRVELDESAGKFVFLANYNIPIDKLWFEFTSNCLKAEGEIKGSSVNTFAPSNAASWMVECRVLDGIVRAVLNGRELVVEVRR